MKKTQKYSDSIKKKPLNLNFEVSCNMIKLTFQEPWKIYSLNSLKFSEVFILAAMHSSRD